MTTLTIQEVIDRYEKLYKKIETYGRFMNRLDKEYELNPIEIATYEEYKQITEYLKELQHYKDLEEQGLLLKLPCNVGDTVYEHYRMTTLDEWDIDEHKVTLEDLNKIGRTVFLTRKEAEAKLAELKGE